MSNEDLCALTGLIPIIINIEEASQFYRIIRGCEKRKQILKPERENNTGNTPPKQLLSSQKIPRTQAQFKYLPTAVSPRRQ